MQSRSQSPLQGSIAGSEKPVACLKGRTMERFIFGLLVALAVAGALATDSKLAAVAAPAPTPVALQYEEITRIEYPPATPIPPGSFDADRAAVIGSASTPAPARHGLFAGVLNGVQGAMGGMQSLQHGTLVRYTYYNGWVRIDNVTEQTATITKCSQHQYVTLDLLHHTYTIASTVPSPAPAPAPGGYPQQPTVVNQAPGTVDMTTQVQSRNLGPMTLEGISTHGSSDSISLVMAHATGSCRNGSISMQIVQYVSGIGIPRAYCPLPRVSGSMPQGTIVRGGCKPTFHGSVSGESLMTGNSNDLGMYRRATYGGAQSNGNNLGFVTEAGNVRWLYRADAEALFTIPPGFTRQQ